MAPIGSFNATAGSPTDFSEMGALWTIDRLVIIEAVETTAASAMASPPIDPL
jgi:hypothetical protein